MKSELNVVVTLNTEIFVGSRKFESMAIDKRMPEGTRPKPVTGQKYYRISYPPHSLLRIRMHSTATTSVTSVPVQVLRILFFVGVQELKNNLSITCYYDEKKP